MTEYGNIQPNYYSYLLLFIICHLSGRRPSHRCGLFIQHDLSAYRLFMT